MVGTFPMCISTGIIISYVYEYFSDVCGFFTEVQEYICIIFLVGILYLNNI